MVVVVEVVLTRDLTHVFVHTRKTRQRSTGAQSLWTDTLGLAPVCRAPKTAPYSHHETRVTPGSAADLHVETLRNFPMLL